MKRRDFIAALGGVSLTPLVAHGQQPKIPKLGILLVGGREPFGREFNAGLRDLGYVEGQNIQIEYRSAEGKLPALAGLAAELVGLNVDLLVASETPAVAAAKRATATLPVVMAPAGDPLGTGLVASLARPGGNVTGLSAATAELAGKSLELIREMLPAVRRIAALADPSNPFSKSFLKHIEFFVARHWRRDSGRQRDSARGIRRRIWRHDARSRRSGGGAADAAAPTDHRTGAEISPAVRVRKSRIRRWRRPDVLCRQSCRSISECRQLRGSRSSRAPSLPISRYSSRSSSSL